MTDREKIDAALARIQQSENRQVARQADAQRPVEPSRYQRQAENEGRSEWSGSWARGGRER